MTRRIRNTLSLVLMSLVLTTAPAVLAQVDPKPEADSRSGIRTRPNERTHILNSMRKYLVGLQSVTEALARDDMTSAARAARSMGSLNLYDVKLMFPNRAAVEFRDLAFDIHRDFDAIAKDAEEKKDPRLMLTQIAAVMKKCAHCHDTYKLQDIAH